MIYVGKIVNTHGIKGELRILSNFKYKNEILTCVSISFTILII